MKAIKKRKYSKYINYNNIRAEMARNRITYQDMAEKMGYTHKSGFANIISGNVQPTVSQIICLINELNKPFDYFFYTNVNESESNQEVSKNN